MKLYITLLLLSAGLMISTASFANDNFIIISDKELSEQDLKSALEKSSALLSDDLNNIAPAAGKDTTSPKETPIKTIYMP